VILTPRSTGQNFPNQSPPTASPTKVKVVQLGYSVEKILSQLAIVRDYYAQFPFVRRCAIWFGEPKRDNDVGTIATNLANFVKQRVRYVPDPFGFEYATAPDVMLAEILQRGRTHGDCDDHVLLLNTLLCSVGFSTRFVAVKLPPARELFDHVVTGVDIDGAWKIIDPCAKSILPPLYLEQYHVA
jgi:hypothetical protein